MHIHVLVIANNYKHFDIIYFLPHPIQHRNSIVDEWSIPYKSIKIHELVGRGPVGEVYRGYWHGEVAIKRFSMPDASPDQINRFKEEVAILKKTRHENLALFMGASLTAPDLAIVTRCVYVCEGEREGERKGGREGEEREGEGEGERERRRGRERKREREMLEMLITIIPFPTASAKVVPSTNTSTSGVSHLLLRRASTLVVKWPRQWATSMPGALSTKISTPRTSSLRKIK